MRERALCDAILAIENSHSTLLAASNNGPADLEKVAERNCSKQTSAEL